MTLRQINIILLVLVAALAPLSHSYPAARWWGLTLLLAGQVSIVVYGCINIQSGYFMPVLCRAMTGNQVVAISFDDGPGTLTPQVLATLGNYGVEAAFFFIGKNIAGNEGILQKVCAGGHIIGNHSFSHHFWFDLFGSRKMLADMRQMDEATAAVTGLKPLLFRPPYGVMNPNLRKAIKAGGYTPVGWSVRSLDTATNDKQKLLSRITGNLKAGDIILLHDPVKITGELLPEIIETIRGKGFEIMRLDKMLNTRAYA